VATVFCPAQKVVPAWLQLSGGVGHVQSEAGAVPAHGLPAGHAITFVTARHPSLLVPHVTRSPGAGPRQELPAPAAHSGGGAAQEQLAEPKLPVHGLPVGQVTRLVIARQPLSRPHVATTVPDSQNVPCWFMHDVGGVAHEHEADGWVPVHGLPVGQVTGDSL
jgi:hypothetical protein